jgi:hypothetical protein
MDGNNLTKYIFFREVNQVRIENIKLIEAVSIRDFDKATIKIGKGPFEDEYIFVMKNGSSIKTSAKCMNDNGITLGRYLNKIHKIRFVEKEKIKYFNT